MYECANCGSEQVPTRFDEDIVELASANGGPRDAIVCIEQVDQPPGWAVDEASEGFEGAVSQFCASCWWDVREAAFELAEVE